TVRSTYVSDVPGSHFRVVPDATRWNKFKLMVMALKVFWIVLRTRPHAIISTGAAPGYFAIRFGRLLGARTCWIDSIANAEELSLSGRKAIPHATEVLSQWKDVADSAGVAHAGSVL
ncbi:MAG: hypothetical protein RLZZ461_1205, partial [Planctomycetota bacterium]